MYPVQGHGGATAGLDTEWDFIQHLHPQQQFTVTNPSIGVFLESEKPKEHGGSAIWGRTCMLHNI